MGRPDVVVLQSNGNLDRLAEKQDGTTLLYVTGVAVGGKFALGDLLGPFYSPEDADTESINAAYDVTNTSLAYQHIVDFFAGAGNGTKLYVVVQANTVTMAQITDKTAAHAATHLSALGGEVRILIVTRIPDVVGTITNQIPADILTAITNAQALRDFEYEAPRHRPIQIFLEGHNWGGTASTTKDQRTVTSNRVTVVLSQDRDKALSNAAFNKYANAAFAGGVVAGDPVHRNPGRVKSGARTHVTNAGISSGALVSTLTEANLQILHEFGYMIMWKHSGKDGWFFSDFPTCVALTDDYAYGTEGRTMDKAARIIRTVYLEELLDDVQVNPETGKLDIGVVKNYQGICDKALNLELVSQGEASGAKTFTDPAQDVNTTDKIVTKIQIVKKGTARNIEATVGFALSLS